jgi:outer membrane lipoprotein-sorting protein
MNRITLALVFSAFTVATTSLSATETDPAKRGYEIAREMTERDSKFQSYRMNMEMVLRDRQGQQSARQIRGSVLEVEGDGDKYLMVFETPLDTKGTAFLSFAHPSKPDDQWLYLPSLKRTKRIASDSKAGSFMGSEFAFEDLTTQELQKYDYKYLGEERQADRASFKIERVPRYEGSGYTRQLMWVYSERYVPLSIQFFDRRGELQKTLQLGGYKLYEGKFWKAASMTMENHLNGKSTVITLSNYQFKAGLSEQDFDPQRLEYVR